LRLRATAISCSVISEASIDAAKSGDSMSGTPGNSCDEIDMWLESLL
jgi:hypothetical protein